MNKEELFREINQSLVESSKIKGRIIESYLELDQVRVEAINLLSAYLWEEMEEKEIAQNQDDETL